MPKRVKHEVPSDETILGYDNVPLDVAARYIGWSSCNVAYALQQERAPYGCAAQTGVSQTTGRPTYSYNISPGLLVAYKHGTIQAWRLGELVRLFEDRVGLLVDARLDAAAELVRGVCRSA